LKWLTVRDVFVPMQPSPVTLLLEAAVN
jgi:hypothetical protein